MPVMGSVDALSNGAAIKMKASPLTWASILAIPTDVALFFDKMFTGGAFGF
jgi:hypothetical protein